MSATPPSDSPAVATPAAAPASPAVEPAPKKSRSASPRPKARSRSPSPTAVLRPSKNRTTVADSATSQTAMHLGDYTPSEWASLPSTAQRASAHVDVVNAFTPFSERSPALRYTELATCGKARAGRLELPHGVVRTPVFMPVGTQGTLKGICSQQVAGITAGPRATAPAADLTYSVAAAAAYAAAVAKGAPAPATVPPSAPAPASAATAVAAEAEEKGQDVKVDIILGNTYHLGVRPGTDVVHRKGGLHHFMNWPRNILTDSGGFQMVSLVELAEITEAGVKFKSPVDGSALLLTPERSVQYQNEIGGDILMALDDVCHSMTVGPRVEEAMERSIRWLDRCIAAHKKSHVQNLFGIIQGGLQAPLRERCLDAMIKRDLPGYAIGGLAGGEDKAEFWQVVDLCTKHLPRDKPRYLMGVGYPVDLLVCVAMGVDMFDCVWPCRTARFGTAIVPDGLLKLQKVEFKDDQRVICEDCPCDVCRKWKYPRSFLHHIAGRQPLGCHLLTIHNIGYMAYYMDQMRSSILEERFPAFVYDQLKKNFPDQRLPGWVFDALAAQGFLFGEADTPYGAFIRDAEARAAADVRIAPRERPEGMRDPEAARAAAEAAAAAALPVEVALAALAKSGAGAGAATDVKHGAELDIASAPRK